VRHLRIGTRGSLLAKWQAESVRKQLFQATGVEAEIVIIKTAGDKMQQAPLTQIGGREFSSRSWKKRCWTNRSTSRYTA